MFDAGVGGEVVHGDDHGVRGADRLVVLEQERGLGGVGGGILRGLGGLCGERERKGQERKGESGEGADFFPLGSHFDWSHCMAGAGQQAWIRGAWHETIQSRPDAIRGTTRLLKTGESTDEQCKAQL